MKYFRFNSYIWNSLRLFNSHLKYSRSNPCNGNILGLILATETFWKNPFNWIFLRFNPWNWSVQRFNPCSWSVLRFNPCSWSVLRFNPCSWSVLRFNPCSWSVLRFNPCSWSVLRFNPCIWNILGLILATESMGEWLPGWNYTILLGT